MASSPPPHPTTTGIWGRRTPLVRSTSSSASTAATPHADNATYFGVFSNPDGASAVSPQRALDDLGAVARMVREATGVKETKIKKRRSFRDLVYNSLTRSKSKNNNIHKTPDGVDGANRCAAADSNPAGGPSRGSRPTSLPVDPLPPPSSSWDRSSSESPSSPFYVNESVFGSARPPMPPDRTFSLPAATATPNNGPKSPSLSQPGPKLATPRILHQTCRLNDRLGAALGGARPRLPHSNVDVSLLYAGRCDTSVEWAEYFARGFSVPGNVRRVRCDAIEAFSCDRQAEEAEEAIAHAAVQVLLVSPALLQWARLSRGRLSLDFLLSSDRLVTFLIGVKKSDVYNDQEIMRFLSALDRCAMVFEASESNDEQFALAAFNGIKSTLKRQHSSRSEVPRGLPSPRLRAQSEPTRSAAATAITTRSQELQFSVSPENVSPSRRQIFLFLHRHRRASPPPPHPSSNNVQVHLSLVEERQQTPACIFQLREGVHLRWVNEMTAEAVLPEKAFNVCKRGDRDARFCCHVDLKMGERYLGRATLTVDDDDKDQIQVAKSELRCDRNDLDAALTSALTQLGTPPTGDPSPLLHFAARNGLENVFRRLLADAGASPSSLPPPPPPKGYIPMAPSSSSSSSASSSVVLLRRKSSSEGENSGPSRVIRPKSRQEILDRYVNCTAINDYDEKTGCSPVNGPTDKLRELPTLAGFSPTKQPPPSRTPPTRPPSEHFRDKIVGLQEMYLAQTAALLEMAEWQGQQPEVATREAEAEWAKLQKMAEERTKRESAAWKSMKAAFKSVERKKRNSGPSPASLMEEKGNVARTE